MARLLERAIDNLPDPFRVVFVRRAIEELSIEETARQLSLAEATSPGGAVDHVDVYFNAGHPGVEKPHAHVVLWHVPEADESRVAQ